MNACNKQIVNVIAHPWCACIKQIRIPWVKSLEDIPYRYLREFAECAAYNKKAIEIPAGLGEHQKAYGVSDEYLESYEILVKELLKFGVKVTIGGDVHHQKDIGKTRWAVELFEKCGGTEKDIWLPFPAFGFQNG